MIATSTQRSNVVLGQALHLPPTIDTAMSMGGLNFLPLGRRQVVNRGIVFASNPCSDIPVKILCPMFFIKTLTVLSPLALVQCAVFISVGLVFLGILFAPIPQTLPRPLWIFGAVLLVSLMGKLLQGFRVLGLKHGIFLPPSKVFRATSFGQKALQRLGILLQVCIALTRRFTLTLAFFGNPGRVMFLAVVPFAVSCLFSKALFRRKRASWHDGSLLDTESSMMCERGNQHRGNRLVGLQTLATLLGDTSTQLTAREVKTPLWRQPKRLGE